MRIIVIMMLFALAPFEALAQSGIIPKHYQTGMSICYDDTVEYAYCAVFVDPGRPSSPHFVVYYDKGWKALLIKEYGSREPEGRVVWSRPASPGK